jgi:hypothetical protein
MAQNKRVIIPLAILAGIVLLVVAGVYFAEPAHSLPSFFPGHVGKGSSEYSHHHTKHGIAAVVVGVGCFVIAWFAGGPKTPAAERPAA